MPGTESIVATQRPLHLVVVTHYFPEHCGGIELVAAAVVCKLTENSNVVVEWFASDCDAPPEARAALIPNPMPTWNNLEASTGLPYPLWSPIAWPRLWRAIKRSNIVHIHDYIYLGSLLAWCMAKLAHRPCIFTQHVGDVPLNNRLLRSLLRVANATLGRLVLGRSAAVVFVSDVVRRQFFSTNHVRARVIANGVDTSIFCPLGAAERSALRSQHGFGERQPVLLFVGRFVDKKGLPLLRQLVAHLPQAHWVFAGRGPLDPEAWGLSSIRIFRDRSGPTLAELYQAADLLVLPSSGEGFPLVVQEALACGTPVLTSSELIGALPGLNSVLMTEEVKCADAVDRWLARLTSLIAAPETLAARRQAAAAYAAKHWSWECCANTYIDLYNKAITK